MTPESLARAKEYYEQAIPLDPKFALPYAALAAHYGGLAALGLRPPKEVMPQLQEWAQKALGIDSSLLQSAKLQDLSHSLLQCFHLSRSK
jgi:hypothetical protein